MKKQLKRAACMLVAVNLLVVSGSNVYAVTYQNANDNKGYDCYSINFASTASAVNATDSNIEQAKDFVKSLALDEKGFIGLEDSIMDELEMLDRESGNISSYSVLLPRSNEYYGHYDGFMFQAAYTYATQYYEDKLYDDELHGKWADGIVNVLLNFTLKRITIPFAILTTQGGEPMIFDSAVTQISNTDEVVTRYIMIQDLNQQVSLDKYQFVPIIMDQTRISKSTVVCFPNGPYGDSMMEQTEPVEIPTPYFYDKEHNLSTGYNHYIAGVVADPITYLVPAASLEWDE